MRKLLILSVAAAAIALPTASQAQALPAAVIAVVDLEKVTTDCTACKAARASLQGQVTALQNRQKALGTPLETEQKSIQAAIDALDGKQPDAALQARIKAWETKRQQATQEISTQEDQIKRNSTYVSQQIAQKLGPIYQSVMQRRGATVMVEMGATLATASQLDVSNDVLTALNTALPSVSTTAPAQQRPQGR